MARDIVINDFSGGMTGEQGQFAAKDNTYVKDIQNGIVNRGGTISPRPGIEELDINLLPHDKILPFRFRDKDYFLVYDTLLKRRWTDINADFSGIGVSISGGGWGNHDIANAPFPAVYTENNLKDYRRSYYEGSLGSGLRVISRDPALLASYFSKITETERDTAFELAFPPIGIDYVYDSFFWQRMVIFNDKGVPVCHKVERAFYVDEDSGHEELNPTGGSYGISSTTGDVEFNVADEELPTLRMNYWGGSDVTYDAAISHDYVIFASSSGKAPPFIWRPLESDSLQDLRIFYHPQLSHGYVSLSYLTGEELLKWNNALVTDGLPFNTPRTPLLGAIHDSYASPFSDVIASIITPQQKSTNKGMEIVEGLFNFRGGGASAKRIETYRKNEVSGGDTLQVIFNGGPTIAPITFPYVILLTKRLTGSHKGDFTDGTPFTSRLGQTYTSWRFFPNRGKGGTLTYREPEETISLNVAATSGAFILKFPLLQSGPEPWIEGNYIINRWGEVKSRGERGIVFRTHRMDLGTSTPSVDQTVPNLVTGAVSGNITYDLVLSAPTRLDVVIPNIAVDSYEAVSLRSGYSTPFLESGTTFLASGANKGGYWKYALAAFGKIILANAPGKENELLFTQSETYKSALDFSTLDLLAAPLLTPPADTKLLGGSERLTKEGGISIQWLAFLNNELRVGTTRGILSLDDLYPGSAVGGRTDTTLSYDVAPTITNGNEYFLSPSRKEIFYNRYSREYQSSRQFNVSYPLFTDVLSYSKVKVLQGLVASSLLAFVANKTLYLGTVDDTKKDEQISWSRMKFTKGDVGEMRVVGEHIYMGLENNEGKSIVRFTPTGNTPWGKEKVVSAVEFLNTWVYLLQERNRDATLDLATTPEATTATNVKIIAHIGEKDLAVLDENDGVSAIIKSVKGQIPFIDTGGALGHTQGLRIKLTNQEDVLEMVSFLVSNS